MRSKVGRLINLCAVLLILSTLVSAAISRAAPLLTPGVGPTLPNPILFVTQVPVPADFTTIGSVFGNHRAAMDSVSRGGDLWIRYPDGTLKNLTAAAGYGSAGFQGENAIAVRDPAVHWDGNKALFSMVIGAPTQRYQVKTFYWQLYEISGLTPNDTPVITKVPNQPANYNNISPIYGTDDQIIFTSDRPRSGEEHLYPQLDEYESAPTNSGLWRLNPTTGDLRLLNHAPSGDFTPMIDSFGRVVFTQWDHLQRDQQADADKADPTSYGTFNYADESAGAAALYNDRTEVFPEPRGGYVPAGSNLNGHTFNHFLPWQIHEDGAEAEILGHLGRHELHGYIPATLNDDPTIFEYYGQVSRFNPNSITNMLQVKEDPTTPGLYYGIDAPEFSTHAAGQIIRLSIPPTVNADHVAVTYVTHRSTASYDDTPVAEHSGLYRDPLPLTDGSLIAVHTTSTRADANEGTRENPLSRYAFRLKTVTSAGNDYAAASQVLTPGLTKSVNWWDPDEQVTYNGELWELQPAEVRVRTRPARLTQEVPGPEQQIFAQAGVDIGELQAYLAQNNLALMVTRNVTTRDDFDRQQPYNLKVFGSNTQTLAADKQPGDKIYEVAHLQIFQADLIRGMRPNNSGEPRAGRRVLAQPLHMAAAIAANPPNPNGPAGSVVVAADGSVAAFVPASRAMTWQLTDAAGVGVVRERNWISFQPGEIRVCGSCHGLSEKDQAGQLAPTNQPQALLQLLTYWKGQDNPPVSTATPTPLPNTPTPTTTPSAVTPAATAPTATPVISGNVQRYFLPVVQQ